MSILLRTDDAIQGDSGSDILVVVTSTRVLGGIVSIIGIVEWQV